ncbi:MAG: TetR/AcrR family transcriptional regulator [Tissierellia bacterium]|nr:TetR/AcrR family transcriptional regulator [Tissierellia bacterium]
MDEKKEKSFERREELINAALIEFGDKGYDNASLNNILKEAGISKGTFYYHFKNKEDLYIYLYGILAQEKMDFFSKNIAPEEFNKDFFTLLKTMFKVGIKFAHYRPEIAKFSKSFLKDLNRPLVDKIMNKFNLEGNNYLNNLIDVAYDRGEIREDLPREFVKNMINYLFINLHEISNITEIEDYVKEANYLMDFLKDGIGRKGAML